MRTICLILCCTAFLTELSAAPVRRRPGSSREVRERISEDTLLSRDKLYRYTITKPCGLDKYKFFCCPVRKIVRRTAREGVWTDYCYNGRDELIGIRKSNHRGSVKRSDFSAVSGCSQCGSEKLKHHSWKHDTRPRMAPAKSKRRR